VRALFCQREEKERGRRRKNYQQQQIKKFLNSKKTEENVETEKFT